MFLAVVACGEPRRLETVLGGAALGTTWSVKVITESPLEEREAIRLRELVELEIERVDAAMSTYREDSELSRLNRSPAGQPTAVDPLLFELIATSLALGRESGGAFDMTVGPLVNAWGFGPRGPRRVPSDDEIERLLGEVGAGALELDRERGTITRRSDGVFVDLSAIAKGLAVDLVADGILAAGYFDHLVEIGGEVRAGGGNQDGAPWRVAIERPPPADGPPARAVQRIVPLRDLALATSGDYRNYFEVDGQRYSHTIDPRTGRPVRHRTASVSVLHQRATLADGYATALLVLGVDRGLRFAEERDLAVSFLVYNDRAGVDETMSTAFERGLRDGTPSNHPPAPGQPPDGARAPAPP